MCGNILNQRCPLSPFFLPFPQDGLLLLAEKLQGPFSFELAAESIGVKVSEGLMHLQENSVKVSAKVRGKDGGEVWVSETIKHIGDCSFGDRTL